jgi:hypothetical protein
MEAKIGLLILCGLFVLLRGTSQAQVTIAVTLTATAQVQSASVVDNGSITTTGAPTKVAINNKSILSLLAVAEHAEGHYLAATFPAGAKLMAIVGLGNNAGPDFEVLDKSNNLLVDVADVLTGANSGTYGSKIASGKSNDTTSLADPSRSKLTITTLAYDDTGIAGSSNIQFVLTGLLSETTADTVPNATTHVYKETRTETMKGGAGDGNYSGVPMVLSGTLTLKGSASLSN